MWVTLNKNGKITIEAETFNDVVLVSGIKIIIKV